MRCHNCHSHDRFVFAVELAATVGGDGVSDPRWSGGLACDRCASTRVAGDPASLR